MLKLEIAGIVMTYRIAPEIPMKVAAALRETQMERSRLEKEVKLLRSRERQLRKFLGQKAEANAEESRTRNENRMNKTGPNPSNTLEGL